MHQKIIRENAKF